MSSTFAPKNPDLYSEKSFLVIILYVDKGYSLFSIEEEETSVYF